MLLSEYLEKKKWKLEESIHQTHNNTINNYIKLKIETLDWFLNLMSTKTNRNDEPNNNIRILKSLVSNQIRYYEKEKRSKELEMYKMIEYNDRIKCLESLSLILLNYEYDLEELISIFD